MNISLNWLRKYIELEMPVQEISEILTNIGLEVEGVKEVESIAGGLKGLVVGQVVECEKHPNADKLSLTKVNVGAEELLQIVCGAPNVAAGQKVIVATVGTMLAPTEGEPFKIKKGKIRGEVSQGMICAEDEIGIGTSHDGIIVLPENIEIGLPAAQYYKLENDVVFDIGLTPNRSDATSHLGVARDLAAYIKVNLNEAIAVSIPEVTSFKVENNAYPIEVVVENETACPRYTGVTITDVEIKSSPDWMQNVLKAIGVRPINNVVDITNFVLHELGQPLHAFDADKIAGKKVIVKNLPQDSLFLSLDEKERKLHAADLMICDGKEKAMCIGGVFGGLHSGVTDNTKNIFLEAAHFSAKSIRNTSTRHLLRTDAAKVFEKGSDPNITDYALKRASTLLVQHANGKISSEIVDIYPKKIAPVEIHVRYQKVYNLIGEEIGKDTIHNILSAMSMEIKPVDEFGIKVKVPTNKADVIREVDIIEEILRIYGFNKVGIPEKISSTIQYGQGMSKYQLKQTVSSYLSSRGWNEMMGLSLMESRLAKKLIDVDDAKLVYINNTSNMHLDIMRPDMIISGLQSVLHNQNYQQPNCRMFEFGKSYKKGEEGYDEKEHLCMYVRGRNYAESWANLDKEAIDLNGLQMKSVALLQRLGLRDLHCAESDDPRFLFAVEYISGTKVVARVGEISEKINKELGISDSVFAAEIDMDVLLKRVRKSKTSTHTLNKFPVSRRDLALVIDEDVKFGRILEVTKSVKNKILKELSLFDIYKSKEHLGEGKKSYALRFQFEDSAKTLKDKDIEKLMSRLIESYEKELSATIRK